MLLISWKLYNQIFVILATDLFNISGKQFLQGSTKFNMVVRDALNINSKACLSTPDANLMLNMILNHEGQTIQSYIHALKNLLETNK